MGNRELPTLGEDTLKRGLGVSETRTPFFPNQGSNGRYRFRPLHASARPNALGVVGYGIKVTVVESNNPAILPGSIWLIPFQPTTIENRDMKVRQFVEFCAAICRAQSVRTQAVANEVMNEVLDAADAGGFNATSSAADVWATYADERRVDKQGKPLPPRETGVVYSNLTYVCPAD
jgi:hypothetical protein